MMTASAMSAAIRAKKKKMMDDQEAVKLSGIPMDATDIDIEKQHEATDGLNENHPKEHEEEPELPAEHADEVKAEPHDEMAPDPHELEEKMKKHAKIKAMMGKLGR